MDGSSPPRSSSNPNKRQLSIPRRWLIERCQFINFGSLKFFLCGGEPDRGKPYHESRTVKVDCGSNEPRREAVLGDFELRREHTDLLKTLKSLPDGTCVRVKVAHGLPGASIDIEETHQAA